jgi:hypothetical protein
MAIGKERRRRRRRTRGRPRGRPKLDDTSNRNASN